MCLAVRMRASALALYIRCGSELIFNPMLGMDVVASSELAAAVTKYVGNRVVDGQLIDLKS